MMVHLVLQIAKQAKLENQLIPMGRQSDNAIKERDAGRQQIKLPLHAFLQALEAAI